MEEFDVRAELSSNTNHEIKVGLLDVLGRQFSFFLPLRYSLPQLGFAEKQAMSAMPLKSRKNSLPGIEPEFGELVQYLNFLVRGKKLKDLGQI